MKSYYLLTPLILISGCTAQKVEVAQAPPLPTAVSTPKPTPVTITIQSDEAPPPPHFQGIGEPVKVVRQPVVQRREVAQTPTKPPISFSSSSSIRSAQTPARFNRTEPVIHAPIQTPIVDIPVVPAEPRYTFAQKVNLSILQIDSATSTDEIDQIIFALQLWSADPDLRLNQPNIISQLITLAAHRGRFLNGSLSKVEYQMYRGELVRTINIGVQVFQQSSRPMQPLNNPNFQRMLQGTRRY